MAVNSKQEALIQAFKDLLDDYYSILTKKIYQK